MQFFSSINSIIVNIYSNTLDDSIDEKKLCANWSRSLTCKEYQPLLFEIEKADQNLLKHNEMKKARDLTPEEFGENFSKLLKASQVLISNFAAFMQRAE